MNTTSHEPMLSDRALEELNQGVVVASTLYDKGLEQLDTHLIRGEKRALTSFIGGLISGGNVILVSIYGSGKTELVSHGYKIVDDIKEDNVVFVPGRPDMTPAELVGKSQEIVTTTELDGDVTTQRQRGEQTALIHPKVQILGFDEASRGNPRTLDSAAQITGSRMLETKDGKVSMDDLEMVVLAMNPTESLRTTSKLSGAMAARQSWGTILGHESVWDDVLEAVIDDDFIPRPNEIQPVVSKNLLHVARRAIRLVTIEKDLKPFIKQATKETLYALKGSDAQILEAPGRVARQIVETSRTTALMHGRTAANEEDVEFAVENKLTASLTGNGLSDLDQVGEIYQATIDKLSA